MTKQDIQTLVNFIHTQSPVAVYLIPDEDTQGRDVDPTDAGQIGDLMRSGELRQIDFSAMNLSDFGGADEQHDAGGLIVDAGAAHYLIAYAPAPVPRPTADVDAARHVRDLFGPAATAIAAEFKLTDDAPRSLIACGLRVYDAAGTELAVPWTAYAELAINEHDAQNEPCLNLGGGEVVPLGSPEVYAAALQADPGLIMGINDLLIDADTPFELVQALNGLGQATGWTRLELPPVQSSVPGDVLRGDAEEQLRLELQAQFSGLDAARAGQAATHLLRSMLSGLGPQGQHAGALRQAYGLDTE